MSATLRRIIDLGLGRRPRARARPATCASTTTARSSPRRGASWVRLWADWPTLQPDPARPPDDPDGAGAPFLAALDDQIRAANEDGIKVLLQLYRFPLWANGLEALGRPAQHRRRDLARVRRPHRRPRPGRPTSPRARPGARTIRAAGRSSSRLPPEGVGPGSAWARFFAFVYDRWHLGRRGSGPYVHGFELVNEPNFQWWPQRAPAAGADPFALGDADRPGAAGADDAHRRAASPPARGGDTLLFAPSFADSEVRGRTVTQYDELTAARCSTRSPRSATSPGRTRSGPTTTTRTSSGAPTDTKLQRMRALLAGRWTGLAEGAAPTVWVTEGGVRLARMAAYYPAEDRLAGPGAELAARLGAPLPRRRARAPASGCSPSTRRTPSPASTAGCSSRGPPSCGVRRTPSGRRSRASAERRAADSIGRWTTSARCAGPPTWRSATSRACATGPSASRRRSTTCGRRSASRSTTRR